MKALIYCRVSSQRQVNEGHGLDSQEKRCRDFAIAKGYDVERVFPDEGISGGLFERPAIKALIHYLDEHPLDKFVVIFDDLARFARDVQVHLQLKAEFTSRGATIECLNFNFEDSPAGELVEIIMAGFAQYHRKDNRRQVMQKMKARIESGYWPFMPPVGWRNRKDPVHGKILTPVEPFATIFKNAFIKYRDGLLYTQDDVRRYLHKEFELAGLQNRPSMSTVQQMLKNPIFAGYLEYPEWDIKFMKAQHEGIISLETFNLVQQRLQERTKPWKRRDYSSDFPLRQLVLCDACGFAMTASWNKGRNEYYPNYFCRQNSCSYKWKTVRKQILEAEFEELLSLKRPPSGYVDLAADVIQEQWTIRTARDTEIRNQIYSETKLIETKVASYLEQIGNTTDKEVKALYEQSIQKLLHEKKQKEAVLGPRKYTDREFGTATEIVLGALKEPVSMWKSRDYDKQRSIVYMYFEGLLRYDLKNGFGTASLAYPVRLINSLGQAKNKSVEMSGSEPECGKS